MSTVPFEQRAHRVILYENCEFPLTNTGALAEVKFVDFEEFDANGVPGMEAYTFTHIFRNPDLSRVRREEAWENLKPGVHGPRDAVLEWGPNVTLGNVAFGTRPRGPMAALIVKKRDASRAGKVSRYFSIQGVECKWKIDGDRWECVDASNRPLAEWVRDHSRPNYYGRLIVHKAGYLVITEIVATLVLNRIATIKNW
ncbi:hypothetical protein AURDEDRAFT_117398 [Auricularia subglabra TFB-10046 SS5]|nr:hypothetical protein AURDEDRAFT_117398 [Auricularia subglabra TFB-10046 SS5]